MENLEVIIQLPNLKLNIPEKHLNFHYLEKIIFDLSRKIGQEILEELLQLIDDKLMAEREKRLRYLTTSWEISPSTRDCIRTKVGNTAIFWMKS
jgi:transcriptional regulator CtsR